MGSTAPKGFHPVVLDIFYRVKATFISSNSKRDLLLWRRLLFLSPALQNKSAHTKSLCQKAVGGLSQAIASGQSWRQAAHRRSAQPAYTRNAAGWQADRGGASLWLTWRTGSLRGARPVPCGPPTAQTHAAAHLAPPC